MADDRRLLHAICASGGTVPSPETETIERAGLAAICSPLDEGADDADPVWLAAAAQRHHAIVQRLFEAAPVLPIRFGTLIDKSNVEPLLGKNQAELCSELERLRGRAEWGAKVLADPAALASAAEQSDADIAALDAEVAASSPGRAFLLKRQREVALSDALRRHADNVVEQVRNRLSSAAIDSAELAVPAVMPAGREILANLAFLVSETDAQSFTAAADAVAREVGLEVEISGPWAPYSFVRLNLGAGEP